MAIPRNLGNLASGADTNGVLGVTKGGIGLTSPGTSGNVLVSNGTAWTSVAPAGGSMVFLASATPSSGTITFEDVFTGYDTFVIIGTNITVPSSTNVEFIFKLGGTFLTSGYNFAVNNSGTASGTYVARIGENFSGIRFYTSDFNTAPLNFNMYLTNPTSTTTDKYAYWTGAFGNRASSGFGLNASTSSELTGIRFGGGTINAGICRLYGIKNS